MGVYFSIFYSTFVPVFVIMASLSFITPSDNAANIQSKIGLAGGSAIIFSAVVVFAISAQIVEAQVQNFRKLICTLSIIS